MSSQDTTTYNTKQYYSYTDLKRKLNIFNGENYQRDSSDYTNILKNIE